jgi:hypothetical protein
MENYLTVVLGAGASKDCVAEGEISQFDNEWRPPLASELFAARPNFNAIMTRYPKVNAVSERIRTKLRNQENLEDILQELESSQNLQVQKQVWEVAFYLQELLWNVSDQFITSGGTKFDTLVSSLLTAGFDRILFLTLNYDLLLDNALARFEDHSFGSMQDYVPQNRNWALVKAHGSVNWGRPLLNGSLAAANPDAALGSLAESPNLSSETEIIRGSRGLLGFSEGQRVSQGKLLFPALAIPTRGEKDFQCPREHVRGAKKFVEECANFLFIGFSGLDPHVLGLFVGVQTVKKIMVVNFNRDEGKQMFERLRKRNDRLLPAGRSETVDPYISDRGFRAFMEAGGLSRFLEG